MTQNEVSIIKNAVLDATEAYVDARLNMAGFVKTQIGVTSGTPTERNGKYYHTVKCASTSGVSGITYTNVLSVGNIEFPANSVVFLIAPNAQYTNQFILGKLDTSPCNIVGGSININGKFNVDKNGNLNINDKFYVSNAGDLYVGGTSSSTAPFYVTNAGKVTIKSGSININNKFYVNDQGNLFVGGTSTSNAPFYVTNTGYLKSTSGNIGGFEISGNDLTVGDAKLSADTIGCGEAGRGIAMLRGKTSNNIAYIQFSASGSPSTCIDGFRLYANGVIQHYDTDGDPDWQRNFSSI